MKVRNKFSDLPIPLAATVEEGGEWIPWDEFRGEHRLCHSILFEDGTVFDCVNGWRRKQQSVRERRIYLIRHRPKTKIERTINRLGDTTQ
jgi:hypothetical protein